MDRFHILPVNNYQYGQSPQSPQLFAQVFLDRYFSKKIPDGCYLGCDSRAPRGPKASRSRGDLGPAPGWASTAPSTRPSAP